MTRLPLLKSIEIGLLLGLAACEAPSRTEPSFDSSVLSEQPQQRIVQSTPDSGSENPSHQRLASGIEQSFESEARDEAWADGRERQIRVEVGRVSGVRAINAECKSRVCRVEIAFSSFDSQTSFNANLNSTQPKHQLYVGGVVHVLIHDPATLIAVWWLSRPGYWFDSDGIPRTR